MSDVYKLDGTDTPQNRPLDHLEKLVRAPGVTDVLEYPKVVGYFDGGEPLIAQNPDHEASLREAYKK